MKRYIRCSTDNDKYTYKFHGKAFDKNSEYLGTYNLETKAVSFAQARNNFKGKINELSSLPYNRIVNITDSDISMVLPVELERSLRKPKHAECKECGSFLTDAGTCPVCDEGEEDY